MPITRFSKASLVTTNPNKFTNFLGNYAPIYRSSIGAFVDATPIAQDSSGNLYFTGNSVVNNYSEAPVIKLDSNRNLVWQRKLTNGTGELKATGIAVSSAGDVYVTGVQRPTTDQNGDDLFLVKYNSSGVLQWQRKITPTASFDNPGSVGVDSAGNVAVSFSANQSVHVVFQYSSSGTLNWQRSWVVGSGLGPTIIPMALTIDNSNNIIVTLGANYYDAGGATGRWVGTAILKYSSTGTLLWQRHINRFSSANHLLETTNVVVDSSNNIYFSGGGNTPGWMYVYKLDSNGSVVWQRYLGTASNPGDFAALDSSGNLYIFNARDTYDSGYSIIVKFDSSGNLVWQRKLTSYLVSYVNGVLNLSSATMKIFVSWTNSSWSTIDRLTDGTGTGWTTSYLDNSYNSYTFETTTSTNTTSTYTETTNTLTDAAGTAVIDARILVG